CVICYDCENIDMLAPNFDPGCGGAYFDGQTKEDIDADGCFTAIYPQGFGMRSVDGTSDYEDHFCENYGDDYNFIGYCYCKGDLCNNDRCQYCINNNATTLL
ncbi:unnamed protein product, partial [Meganyctiphanes norvegica]